jgi:hypothetical protein
MNFNSLVQDRIDRLTKIGGEIYKEQVVNGNDVAAVGQNQGVHFVMYPDNTFDRFEKDQEVKYRKGWKGPVINDPSSVRARQEQAFKDQMAAIAAEKAAKRASRRAKKAETSGELSLAERLKRYEIEVPAQHQEVIELARPAFDFFFEEYGPTIDKKIGDSVREKENWSDPEYILEYVTDKMKPYFTGDDATGEVDGDGPACTPDEWREFKELETPYQLTLAVQFAGLLPY